MRLVRVWLLDAERSAVGWPVEVVTIVGQELLGDARLGVEGWWGAGLAERSSEDSSGGGERGRLRELLELVGAVSWACDGPP